jgi:hypothetical protein
MPTDTGRKKYIQTPNELWRLFGEFMQWVEANPYIVEDWVGKDADRVERKKQRPITFLGFKKWLALEGVIHSLSDYETNKNGAYGEYSDTIARIREICNGEIIEGASAGVYNPMIASKLAGLVDKSETKIDSEKPFVLILTENDETNGKADGSV